MWFTVILSSLTLNLSEAWYYNDEKRLKKKNNNDRENKGVAIFVGIFKS